MSFSIQSNAAMKNTRSEMKDKDRACKHCAILGHEEGGCFQLIGYPERWGDRTHYQGRGGGRGRRAQSGRREGYGREGYARENAARPGHLQQWKREAWPTATRKEWPGYAALSGPHSWTCWRGMRPMVKKNYQVKGNFNGHRHRYIAPYDRGSFLSSKSAQRNPMPCRAVIIG